MPISDKDTMAFARALYEATKDKQGAELKIVIGCFVSLLQRRAMLSKFEAILGDFVKYSREQQGIVDIAITSARPLPTVTIESIKNIFGDKVEATVGQDPSLLGGVVVRTKDKILDGSLRTQLNNLKMKMMD